MTVNKDGSVPIIPAALSLTRTKALTHTRAETHGHAVAGVKEIIQAGSATTLRLEPRARKCKRGKGEALLHAGLFALHPVSKVAIAFSSLLQNTSDD